MKTEKYKEKLIELVNKCNDERLLRCGLVYFATLNDLQIIFCENDIVITEKEKRNEIPDRIS